MKIGEKLHKLLYEYKSLKLQYKKVKEKCKEKQTKEEFENKMDDILKENDSILVKASNSMKFKTIVEKLS